MPELSIIEHIRELFRLLIPPQVKGIKGDILALEASSTANSKRSESRSKALTPKLRVIADFVRLEEKV